MGFQQLDFHGFQKKIGRPIIDGTPEYESWQQRQQIAKLSRLVSELLKRVEYDEAELFKLREYHDGASRIVRKGLLDVQKLEFHADKRGSSIIKTEFPKELVDDAHE